MPDSRFKDAIASIDALNSRDPNTALAQGKNEPEALLYSKRMSQTLLQLYPDASEALKLAVHAQHIERWKVPRNTFPEGRAGYHAWRNDLKRAHAQTAAGILESVGYDEPLIATVQDLIAKKNLATDQQAQALEDTACIVFLAHYAQAFAEKHPPDKVATILAKTWKKMSPLAHRHATKMSVPDPIHEQINALTGKT